jgi:hypothetical protein
MVVQCSGQTYVNSGISQYTYVNPNMAETLKNVMIMIVIHLLTAIGLPPRGSSTVHIYVQTIHRTTQNKQYTEQHKHFGRVRAVPRLRELYPGICLTTEEKVWKNLSQGST